MWVTATVAPRRVEDMAKRERKGGLENETAKRKEKALASVVGVEEGYVMTWKSQSVGHAGPRGALSSRKASESSQAASYLALVGARTQGMNLSPTPACKQTKYRGKDEV